MPEENAVSLSLMVERDSLVLGDEADERASLAFT
jgi:hypothetical protein